MLSPSHIVLLLLVVLLALVVFGPKRLPELGHSVGKALQEFKRASTATANEVREVTTTVTATATPVEPATPEVAHAGAPSDGETKPAP
ncbi:MAG: twin-arginine translocase TatA/TatE family subunit [Candidatus Dormibacteria bacterium]